ncbi:hypothetical protein [[Ruminococcus] torques]|jgi:hypothetical protein|uniref:hypothetical protein n=1 Tax=[Ruminococcus] torques TaxID=33039 RepID=UPI00206642FE|nr:MAG TPA: hypothetical protein [Caudoviricetes sp.]
MSNKNLFEIATKNKFRFQYKGLITVEDLWDLPVTELDSVFKTLNSEMKKSKEESLLDTKSKEDKILEDKISIVKYIVSVKLQDAENRKKIRENQEKKERILQIMADRQDKAMLEASDEDLQKMLDELE